jgi:hypothetical protein
MFGISFFKLLALAGAVASVWYLFKMLAGPKPPSVSPGAERGRTAGTAQRNPRIEAEDMVACTVCGTYVAATGARSCGRADCPWRG